MGNNNKPIERKRKKKGRPSLLDLQKRSLRLQNSQPNPNPNPNPNPYLRFPNAPSGRRVSRRNPNLTSSPADDDAGDEDDERREKKLKLVLRIPNSTSDSERGEGNESSKGTDVVRDLGPTTVLPDKKLLLFILDRLQKKDTYGVYSEPVDPKELPDYHNVIKHPMDFGTVRKKLSGGAYANLEQFEEKFRVKDIKGNADELTAALYLQVSIISQALIFVTRSRSWSFVERPGFLLVFAFFVA